MLLPGRGASSSGVEHWITERLYNAGGLLTHAGRVHRAPGSIRDGEDRYLLRAARPTCVQAVQAASRTPHEGAAQPGGARRPPCTPPRATGAATDHAAGQRHGGRAPGAGGARPVARRHAASSNRPAFAGFVLDVGGKRPQPHRHRRAHAWTSRRGGCARCQPASVRQDDWVRIIGGDAGVVIRRSLAPSSWRVRLRRKAAPGRAGARPAWRACRHARRHAWTATKIELLWPTSRQPVTALPPRAARRCQWAWACSAANFCSLGGSSLPGGTSEYRACACEAIDGMRGCGHHPHHRRGRGQTAGRRATGPAT